MGTELNPDITISIDGTDRISFKVVNAGLLKIPTARMDTQGGLAELVR